MSSVTTIGNAGCEMTFASGSGIVSVDLSGLQSVAINGCYYMFSSQTTITSVDMSSLETVAYMGCRDMFYGCTGLVTANLSKLRTTTDSSACDYMFYGCTALTNVDMSSVEDGNKSYAFRSIFQNCRSLTTFTWSSLAELTGDAALQGAFNSCVALTSLYFPALKSTAFGTQTNQFNGMLYGVRGCTVHFPSNLQSVIGSWTSVTAGFSGTNTTVLFDLPATVTLVGTNSYERNPKFDTAGALAWYDTSSTRATPYYTSGTTDPTVNSAIYSDSACTTQVDTVASIS